MQYEIEDILREKDYSTYHEPYDFYAGGKGFDLLRMKIFSGKYGFNIRMTASRCRFIPNDADMCPGDIINRSYCKSDGDCFNSGGTTVVLQFISTDGIEPL